MFGQWTTLACAFAVTACGAVADDATQSTDDEIVGGRRETRWSAAGYLVSGPSVDRLDLTRPSCGATLIAPNVVVTAAHCVTEEAAPALAFGTGELRSGAVVPVVERHFHPRFHAEAQGKVDLVHALRKYDVAYLVLARAITNVAPAAILETPPETGCNVQSVAFGATSPGGALQRVSMPACVQLELTLGEDPILEVRPEGASGICSTDGDEGSPIVLRDRDQAVLVGFYVGSVTQFLTDCRKRVQFLNGYESAYGYRAFFAEGIARGRAVAAQ